MPFAVTDFMKKNTFFKLSTCCSSSVKVPPAHAATTQLRTQDHGQIQRHNTDLSHDPEHGAYAAGVRVSANLR
jgi:hypothetical protein